jgi:hypothetical protein
MSAAARLSCEHALPVTIKIEFVGAYDVGSSSLGYVIVARFSSA